MSRPEVVKRIWEYVRAHNLQDPSNRKYIQCDTKLQAIFKKKRVDCFSMNRLLTSHMGARDEVAIRSEIDRDVDEPLESQGKEETAAPDGAREAQRRVSLLLGKDVDLAKVYAVLWNVP